MKTRTIVWILVSLALLSLPSVGRGGQIEPPADAAQGMSAFRFKHLTIEDGLSQSSVMAVIQDSGGFMWFGTQNGLNRFDGYTMRVHQHDPDLPGSISDGYVHSLFEDSARRLWVGTEHGLNRYDRQRDTFVRYLHDPADRTSLPGNDVRHIAEDPAGDLWVATRDGGLARFDPDTGRFLTFRHDRDNDASLSSDDVRRVLPAGHIVYVATDQGLDAFDPRAGRFRHYRHDAVDPTTLSSDDVTTMVWDGPGHLWVGTRGGLSLLDVDTGRARRFPSDPDDYATVGADDIAALFIDRRGLLWVGSKTSGFSVLDRRTHRVERYRADVLDPDALHDDMITTFAEDESGLLWLGTESAGVERGQPENVRLYRHHPLRTSTLSSDEVWAFEERPDGLVWVATRIGLNLLDPASGRVTRFGGTRETTAELATRTVWTLEIDRAGRLWAGVTGAGIYRIDQFTGDTVNYRHDATDPKSLPSDRVYALLDDRAGRLWVGTLNGLARMDPGRDGFVTFRHDPANPASLGADEVRRIYQDREGRIWVGTRDGGLNRYESDTRGFTRFVHDPLDRNSLSSNKVWSIHDDGRGGLWVGTLGGGLNRLDRSTGKFERFTIHDGLPDNVIYGILGDSMGDLWLSTNNGISRFSPGSRRFRNLGTNHGLQGKEFNSGAFHQARDGRLWFGGIAGANVIDPTKILDRRYQPHVVLSGLVIDGEPVLPGERADGHVAIDTPVSEASMVRVASSARRVTFEFAALDYARRYSAEYAYTLDGLDRAWTHSGTERTASYSHIPPGRYTFRVRGTNADKTWSPAEAAIDVIVEAAFWQTWWFEGLIVMSAILVFATWYVRRVRAMRSRAHELETQVRIRTEQIQGQVDVIGQQKLELEETLRELDAAKDKLVAHAHRAGMAVIATGVLHNIGNLQNSIATSCTVIKQRLQQSKRSGLARANDLLRAHEGRLAEFLTEDERGRKLPGYYYTLQAALEQERLDLAAETDRLAAKVSAVGDVIASQQAVARAAALAEVVSLDQVVEHALLLEASSLGNHDVKIVKRFEDVPPVMVQKSKVLQVLVNLVKNAKDAMKDIERDRRVITIGIAQDGESVRITVSDDGCGISADGLGRIFSYGFTTKPKGHGFGLHSCANYATEMGGELQVASAGEGLGATFTLVLPLDAAAAAQAA